MHNSTSKSPAKVIFGTEIKLPSDVEFGFKPTTKRDGTYTGKEESLNDLHEFMRTRIRMISVRMKFRYGRVANTEGFHKTNGSILQSKAEVGIIPQATNQLGWTV